MFLEAVDSLDFTDESVVFLRTSLTGPAIKVKGVPINLLEDI
jgi:hypothetical protein